MTKKKIEENFTKVLYIFPVSIIIIISITLINDKV